MNRPFLTSAALLGAAAVALGAFGAHGLRSYLNSVDPSGVRLGYWTTAAHYHLTHALALGLCAVSAGESRLAHVSRWAFALGIGVFSGTLYLMSLTGVRWLGAVTPVGGLALIVGWLAFALAIARPARNSAPSL